MNGLPKAIIKKYGVTKKAWQVFRGRHRRAHVTRPKTGSVRNTARRSWRKKIHRGKSLNLLNTGVKLAKVGALLAPAIGEGLLYSHSKRDMVIGAVGALGGYNLGARAWQGDMLVRMWTPFIAVSLGATAVRKVSGLLRRL